MNITKGKIPSAKKVVVYGAEGIGKSTFVSKFPGVVFIDTEGSTKALDVARFDAPKKWIDILEAVKCVLNDPSICQTLAIDTADWAELLCIKYTCEKCGVTGIEYVGYGKGYVYLQDNFKVLLDKLDKVIAAGINVVITAHAQMRKFEQPDEMGAYDRWEMKLTKKNAPLLKEWADIVLFANYKTFVVEDDKTKSKKAQGGKRVMYTTHHSCWDAKNRFGLADCLPFDYEEIRKVIEGEAVQKKEKVVKAPEQKKPEPKPEPPKEKTVYDELRELMDRDGITEAMVMLACSSKGVCFSAEPLDNLEPEFIRKNLIEKWEGFKKYALKTAEADKTEIPPFNNEKEEKK